MGVQRSGFVVQIFQNRNSSGECFGRGNKCGILDSNSQDDIHCELLKVGFWVSSIMVEIVWWYLPRVVCGS